VRGIAADSGPLIAFARGPVVGGAGVLLAAKDRGLIEAIAPILADWRDWGYFLAPGLVDAILRRARERR
jgi:predicted nucleic acid-binding protein